LLRCRLPALRLTGNTAGILAGSAVGQALRAIEGGVIVPLTTGFGC
jgi:hypothetical protein